MGLLYDKAIVKLLVGLSGDLYCLNNIQSWSKSPKKAKSVESEPFNRSGIKEKVSIFNLTSSPLLNALGDLPTDLSIAQATGEHKQYRA